MASIDKIAKDKLKSAKQDPFSQLDRDLPKGGRQMKIAEPLGSAAIPQAAKSVASKLVGPAAGVVGMLIPTEIGQEEKTIGGGIVPLPQDIKGNPEMQDMAQPTQMSKSQKFLKRFTEEGQKNLSPEFSVDVPVDYTDEETGERENYTLNMKSKQKLNDLQKMKAAGIDASLGRAGGKIKNIQPKGNTVDLDEDDY